MKPDPHTASLPLPEPGEPFTERDAFALCPDLQKRFTYEQAMANPGIAIGLRNVAHAARRARLAKHHP